MFDVTCFPHWSFKAFPKCKLYKGENLLVFDAKDLCVEVCDVVEAGDVCDGVDEHEAVALPHVLLPHGRELLLPGRVQH